MYETLKVLDEPHVTPTREMTRILARCYHCGREAVLLKQNVDRANRTRRKHCAECIKDTFHYMTKTRFWSIWKGMKSRATDPRDPNYERYGGVGRGICPTWLKFENFYADMFESYQDNLTLERKDNSQGYSKENCRWATNAEQQANKSNNRVLRYQGRDIHLAEFCRTTGVSRGAITARLNCGMSAEEALQDYLNSSYPKNRRSRKRMSTIS